jgi:hypothetical protein
VFLFKWSTVDRECQRNPDEEWRERERGREREREVKDN